MNGKLEVRQVESARSFRKFLNLPYEQYRNDPNWVPPLRSAQSRLLRSRTAFFEHAEMALFLAERAGSPIGRIAAIRNLAHNAFHNDKTGFFGFFECVDDPEAAAALFRAADQWFSDRNLDTMRGPVNPSMNAECGLLIEGFGMPPSAMMPYNPEFYARLFESTGLRKCKDLYAYLVKAENVLPGTDAYARMLQMAEILRRRHPEIVARPLNLRRFKDDILRFVTVFEEARRSNWGYVPASRAEILEMAGELRMIIDPEVIIVAEVNGEPAGATLAIPNINRALADLNGRLLPVGLLKFRRAMRRVSDLRILGIAALEKYRCMGITNLLLLEIIIRGAAHGYSRGEASWVLEDNVMSNRTIERALKAERYKTYRLYEKPILRP